MARAPKDRLREREAYEFFVKLDEANQPVWSQDIEERGSIFDFPGKCYRSGITYNAALKRYLWVQLLPTSKNKQANPKAGSMGIYDAPEPWGPWTTVDYAENWDINPGETASFPTKWISEDGKKLQLVFSGDDSFSVRGAELELNQ